MRALRTLIALAAAAAVVALAATLALAAPAALSPTGAASAAQYCAKGVKQQRKQVVSGLSAEVKATTKGVSGFRLAQLKARKAYFAQATSAKLRAAYVNAQNAAYKAQLADLGALKRDLKRAQAQLSRCN